VPRRCRGHSASDTPFNNHRHQMLLSPTRVHGGPPVGAAYPGLPELDTILSNVAPETARLVMSRAAAAALQMVRMAFANWALSLGSGDAPSTSPYHLVSLLSTPLSLLSLLSILSPPLSLLSLLSLLSPLYSYSLFSPLSSLFSTSHSPHTMSPLPSSLPAHPASPAARAPGRGACGHHTRGGAHRRVPPGGRGPGTCARCGPQRVVGLRECAHRDLRNPPSRAAGVHIILHGYT